MQICIFHVGKDIFYLSQSIRLTFMVWREKKKKKMERGDFTRSDPSEWYPKMSETFIVR